MKRKKWLNLICNLFFVSMIGFAFICAKSVSQEDDINVEKEKFVILEENSEISALYFDGNKMWVGTNKGVKIYDPQTLQPEKNLDDIEMVYSAEITRSNDECIWIGYEKGLAQIKPSGERITYQYPDIASGRVNTVLYDDEKIWCGTYNGASVLELKDGLWKVKQHLDINDGLCSDSVNTIIQVQNGILLGSYLDTVNGGITFIRDDGKIQLIRKEQGLPHPYITSMLELPSGEVLVGTGYMEDGGLAVLTFENGEYQIKETLNVESGMPGEKIRYLFYSDHHIFITTEYDGILIVNEEDFQQRNFENSVYLREENGLSDNEIKCVAESDKYYWLGGKYGLTLIEKE